MAQHKSYRCSNCGVNWPLTARYRDCPHCDAVTWGCKDEPDSNELLTEELDLPPASPAHTNRVERYRDMGFSEVDAEQMACAKDAKGFYLYHADIRRQLEAGLTHELALQIYA